MRPKRTKSCLSDRMVVSCSFYYLVKQVMIRNSRHDVSIRVSHFTREMGGFELYGNNGCSVILL